MLRHRLPLAAVAAACTLPTAPAGAKPIAYDLTITASSQLSWTARSTPYDKDCSHHAVWAKESGEETWSVKTPRPYRVTVEPALGTVSFLGSDRLGVKAAAQLRGKWTRTIRRSSGSSPGPCGGDGATGPTTPPGVGRSCPSSRPG